MEEVLKRANDTNYGLAAGVYTNDMQKIHYLVQGIRAGCLWINSWGVFNGQLPFGGYKDSGFGREMGEYGLHQYTELKTVVLKIKKKSS